MAGVVQELGQQGAQLPVPPRAEPLGELFLDAVDGGEVTALLGPNGAGKTTTLRMLLGLVSPSSGTATVGGRRYEELPAPVRQVGAVLETSAHHPGRTALDHLRILATASDQDETSTEAGS